MASETREEGGGSAVLKTLLQFQSRGLPSRRLLGKGLRGIVYETMSKDGARYARKDFVDVPKAVFLAEASNLVRLDRHDNLVTMYGVALDDRSCSLVLEYMDDDLVSFLQKRKESWRSQAVENPSHLINSSLGKFIKERRENPGLRETRKDFVYMSKNFFEDEPFILVGLDMHDNLVKTYDVCFDDRSSSLVLKYLDDNLGLSLLQKRVKFKRSHGEASRFIHSSAGNFVKVRRKNLGTPYTSPPPLELREALDVMFQIAIGMERLHEQNIAHGDLKPRNVLVGYSDEGEEGLITVKVADFGLIRTKSKSMSFVSPRASKLDMAQWKAPEYLCSVFDEKSSGSDSDEDDDTASRLGDDDWLCKADVYSFGLTCFQIVTGEVPYSNLMWRELMDKVVSHGLRPTLPAAFQSTALSDLLESCWGSSAQRPTFWTICNRLIEMIELNTALKPSDSSGGVEPHPTPAKSDPLNVPRHSTYMERMEDDLLSVIITKDRPPFHPPFSHRDSIDILWQVAKAMAHLHEKKVIHCDLKTPDILISPFKVSESQSCYLAKVADFGSAMVYNDVEIFEPGAPTTKYGAPEVLIKFPRIDDAVICDPTKIDVFSFGIIGFEVLTGEEVYKKEREVMKKWTRSTFKSEIIRGTLRPPLRSKCLDPRNNYLRDERVIHLIERCWHQEPSERPPFSDIVEILGTIRSDYVDASASSSLPQAANNDVIQAANEGDHSDQVSTYPEIISLDQTLPSDMILSESSLIPPDWSNFDSFPPQHDPEIISKGEVTVSEPMSTAQPVSPLGEINQNTDPRTIQIETDVSSKVEKASLSPNVDEIMRDRMENKGADVENFLVPAFAVDISKRKRIRRRLIIVFCPGHDEHRSPPDTTEFPAFNSPIDAYRDGYLQRVEPGEGGSEFNFTIPEEATTAYYEHKRKRHLTVVSVRFCKSKTRAVKRFVVDSTHAMLFEDYLEPDPFTPYRDPGESHYVSPESPKYGRRLRKPFRLIPVAVSSLAASSVEFCTPRSKPDLSPLDFPPPDLPSYRFPG